MTADELKAKRERFTAEPHNRAAFFEDLLEEIDRLQHAVRRGIYALEWVDQKYTLPAADRGAGMPMCRSALASMREALGPQMHRERVAAYLEGENERLRGLIKRAEWASSESESIGGGAICPWCEAWSMVAGEPGNHNPDCQAFTTGGEVR